MTKRHINIGRSANDKSGDPLRTAFDKVNQNFDELFATDTLTKYQLGDDEQFVRIELDGEGVPTGSITIQSGFDTAMPVYIKGGNALQDGVGGNVVIEAGAPPLAEGLIQDGGPYAGTVGDIEMAANQVTIETLGGVTTFSSGDGTPYVTFPAVNGSQLGIQGSEISSLPGSEGLALSAREGSIILSTHGDQYPSLPWEFDRSGTINTPLLFPLSFTAVLDVEHRTVGSGTYPGPAWEFHLEWQVNPNGEIECLSDNGPLPSPVAGYANGQTFEFTEVDHGIPNYTLTIVLRDVDHNPAGYTANLDFSAPPVYPSTINSQGAIKLTSNDYSLILDSDGTVIFPTGGRIGDISNYGPGLSTGFFDTNGITMGTAPGNDITITPEDGIGIYSNSNLWTFGTDGNLTLPAGGVIKNSDGSTYGGGGGISISDFGDGFSLTAANKVVTNKLYSTNLTQPNQHYRLELDTNGVVILPDQSIINGSTLRGIYGTGEANYTGITIGPDAAHREESWMYVDHTGSYIATQYNTDQKLWQFKNDGSTIFPSGAGFAKGDNGQLKTNDGTTLTLDLRDNYGRGFYTNNDGYTLRSNGSYSWVYGVDGTLNLPLAASGKGVIQTTGDYYFNADGAIYNLGADGVLTVPGDIKSAAGVGPVTIQANDGTLRTWTFAGTGKLELPAGGDIVDSEGETVLGFASTSYSLSNVLSTILAGATTSGVIVTGDATGMIQPGMEIQFESLAGAEYTVDTVTYNSGDDTTTIIITDYTGFGPVDGDKIYIEYHGVQEIYAGAGIALGVTEGNSGRVLTIAADVKPEQSFLIMTEPFNAVAGYRYAVDTTISPIIAHLPLTPSPGDAIFFVDATGNFSNNNLTIDGGGIPGGNTIMGLGSQDISTNNENIGIFYNGTEWRFYA
jgi:hypothetical protein